MMTGGLIASVAGCVLSENGVEPIATDLHETVVKVPMIEHRLSGDHERDLVTTTYMPDGPGPFPLIVLSHGSPPNARDRPKVGRYRELPQIRTFVQLGFAVIVPIRRGYGSTGGTDEEDTGSCRNPDYTAAGEQAAMDVLAALAYAETLPQVDGNHVVFVGQSAGGFASLAAASFDPKGLVAVVNFQAVAVATRRHTRVCPAALGRWLTRSVISRPRHVSRYSGTTLKTICSLGPMSWRRGSRRFRRPAVKDK